MTSWPAPQAQVVLALLSGFVALGLGFAAYGQTQEAREQGAQESKGQAEPAVIVLTQTGCQFLEPEEGVDHGFKTEGKKDCIKINEKTAEARVSQAKALRLKPGKYVFRVSNKNVPYELGFWLRGAGLARFVQPNVSGGGLTEGKVRDYAVELTPGEYFYSCPLNTTPDYPLVVTE